MFDPVVKLWSLYNHLNCLNNIWFYLQLLAGKTVIKDGKTIVENYPLNLDKLNEGDKFGILRTSEVINSSNHLTLILFALFNNSLFNPSWEIYFSKSVGSIVLLPVLEASLGVLSVAKWIIGFSKLKLFQFVPESLRSYG